MQTALDPSDGQGLVVSCSGSIGDLKTVSTSVSVIGKSEGTSPGRRSGTAASSSGTG